MTLTQFESSLLTLPTFQRLPCAGAAAKLRALTADGEAFATARDRIVAMQQYYEPLNANGQLAAFAAITGP